MNTDKKIVVVKWGSGAVSGETLDNKKSNEVVSGSS